MSGRWHVGVASVDITPAAGAPLSGFAARTQPAAGMHDPLTARAIAFSLRPPVPRDDPAHRDDRTTAGDHGASLVIVVADLVALSVDQATALRVRISRSTGVPDEAVVITVTHTHAGPHVTPDGLGIGQDQAATATAEEGIVAAAVSAWDAREPAQVGHGFGRQSTVAQNRRHEAGIVDPTVTVLRVDTERGDPLAVLFSYSCHPTVLGPANLLYSADWPGFARCAVEAAFPGTTAIFLQGCCGDVNSGHSAHSSMDLNATSGRTFEQAARIGHLLADVVVAVARDIEPANEARLEITGLAVPLPFEPPPGGAELELLSADIARELRDPAGPDRAIVLQAQQRWARRAMHGEFRPPPTADVTAITVGGLDIVTLPGEPFVSLALDLRARMTDRALLVLGYANGVPGYLPYPPEEYGYGGYEVREAHYFYEQAQCFAPDCGLILLDAATRLLLAQPGRAE
jgi:hypothetical protein